MSPTSYQAAPPRVSARNLPAADSKSSRISFAVARIRECIEQVQNLVPADHAELLARDALHRPRIAFDRLPERAQRIDLRLERVDRGREPPLLDPLVHEVGRPVLAPLHDEVQR